MGAAPYGVHDYGAGVDRRAGTCREWLHRVLVQPLGKDAILDPNERLLLYACDCIAATARDFDKKTAPKHARMRHRNICRIFADHLEGKTSLPTLRAKHEVVKRLRDMADILSKYSDPPRKTETSAIT